MLGEVTNTDDNDLLELHCRGGGISVISLAQGARGARTAVWSHQFKDSPSWPYHRSWVERVEELSRGGFVEALEERGYERRERPRSNEYALPLDPQLASLIDEELTFESQFVALRKLHAAIANDGARSPRRIGASLFPSRLVDRASVASDVARF